VTEACSQPTNYIAYPLLWYYDKHTFDAADAWGIWEDGGVYAAIVEGIYYHSNSSAVRLAYNQNP
jgi:hypothetical protein